MADPGVAINCPRCRAALIYVRTDVLGSHFYRCVRDGLLLLTAATAICRCGHGWICERHPDRPWPHRGCLGPEAPCTNPECPFWKGASPHALKQSDWTDLVGRERHGPSH